MDIKNLFVGVNPTPNRSNQSDKNSVQHSNSDASDDNLKSSSAQEKVTLTATATRLVQAQITMNAQPEVNRDRVAEIRKSLAEGSYKIDPARIAGRMISFESGLRSK